MGIAGNIISIMLGLVGLAAIVWLLRVYLRSFFYAANFHPFAFLSKDASLQRAFVKKEHFFKDLDRSKTGKAALEDLAESFFFGAPPENLDFVERINLHNLQVLKRLIKVVLESGMRPDNLKALEQLFEARMVQLRSFAEFKITTTTATIRINGSMPKWAKKEFDQRKAEYQSKVDFNASEIKRELKKIIAAAENRASTEQVLQ